MGWPWSRGAKNSVGSSSRAGKSWWERVYDNLPSRETIEEAGHLALDLAGLIPVWGEAFDAVNAAWLLSKGRNLEALFSAMSVIPVVGDILGKGGKLGMKAIQEGGPKAVAYAKKLLGQIEKAGGVGAIKSAIDKLPGLSAKQKETLKKELDDLVEKLKELLGKEGGNVTRNLPSPDEVRRMGNAQKGVFGEAIADNHMASKGYTKINGENVKIGDAPKGPGIDGIYQNSSPPPQYVVADAKYGTSQLGTLKDGTRQMSDDWIDNRLNQEVGRRIADELREAGYERMVLRVDEFGNVVEKILQ